MENNSKTKLEYRGCKDVTERDKIIGKKKSKVLKKTLNKDRRFEKKSSNKEISRYLFYVVWKKDII